MFNYKDVLKKFPEFNAFTPSDWNALDALPKKVLELMTIAKKNDTVYTGYNFMLCFNLQDSETCHKNWVMFIPDPKFNINL
jgi:hypothetical protein